MKTKRRNPIFYGKFIVLFLVLNLEVISQPSGSVTQGTGVTTVVDMLPTCPSNHITPLGQITSSDGKQWDVPAPVNYYSSPALPDLYNTCNGITPANLSSVNLNSLPVQVIDAGGDTVTGFLFCDNYFELYINGTLVGVDPIPFTPFNSCMVRFKVSRPYTIAVKLVDWEEHLGLGSEIQSTDSFHPGDGGFIAQFSDGTVTDSTWRTQTFYIAPLEDVNDVMELPDNTHSTATATLTPACRSNCFGVHYEIDSNWVMPYFDDTNWPFARLYTAAQVTNQPAYVNFSNTAWGNARFIWSSNLILDNLVLTRKTVGSVQSVSNQEMKNSFITTAFFGNQIMIKSSFDLNEVTIVIYDLLGQKLQEWQNQKIQNGSPLLLQVNNHFNEDQIFLIKVQNLTNSFSGKLKQIAE